MDGQLVVGTTSNEVLASKVYIHSTLLQARKRDDERWVKDGEKEELQPYAQYEASLRNGYHGNEGAANDGAF